MTHPNRQHRVDSPRPGADSEASLGPWPVLARLPRVGEPALAPAVHNYAAEPVSLDDDPYLLEVAQLQAADARRSGPYERQAAASPASDASISAEIELPPAQSHRPAPQWQRRVDPPDHRGQPTPIPAVMRHASTNQRLSTFASRIFQWHASMSPNASAVVAAALLFCACLLCWLTFGRAPSSPPTTTGEDQVSRVHAAATPAEREDSPTHSQPVDDDQHGEAPVVAAEDAAAKEQADADATPVIERSTPINDAKETAATPTGGESTFTTVAASPSDSAQAPARPEQTASPPAPSTMIAQAAASPPTTSPALPAYPVTPYVAFDFSPSTDAAVRTADRSPIEPTSR